MIDWNARPLRTDTWTHKPDGSPDYSFGKPLGCEHCPTIWASSASLGDHVMERHYELAECGCGHLASEHADGAEGGPAACQGTGATLDRMYAIPEGEACLCTQFVLNR